MARRRSGPIEPIRCRPAARSDCIGRKSLSSERFAISMAKVRLATSARRAESITLQHLRRAGIFAGGHGVAHDVGDIGGVAQPHVEALRADRRQHMRGFADQRDAVLWQIAWAARSRAETDAVPARRWMRPRMECDCVSAASDNSSSLSAISRSASLGDAHPHHAAAVAGQRHEHAGTLRGMKLGRDIPMRPRMADVEGQRGLIEFAAPDLDAGGLAAERLPSVGADHEARRQRSAAGRCESRRSSSCGLIASASSSNRVRLESSAARSSSAAISDAVLDVVAELRRGRFRRRKTGPPARGSGGRYRRPAASSATPPPCPRSAARPRAARRKSTEPPSSAVVRLSA